MRRAALCISLVCSVTSIRSTHAQLPVAPVLVVRAAEYVLNDDRSGPRVGVGYIAGGSVTAQNQGKSFAPVTSMFGWQLERQFPTGRKDEPLPVTEFVVLVAGMEQGLFLPSATWLLGLRQPNGWEAGVGPALTGAGVQLAFAAGVTHEVGRLNVPVNLAIAPGRRGAAISLTTGFNVH